MMANELAEPNVTPEVKPGDVVYLIRKVSGHVLEMVIEEASIGATAMIEVTWKNNRRLRYKLDADKDIVHALDSKQSHRDDMKIWYYIWGPHKEALRRFHEKTRIEAKKNKRFAGKY